MIPSSEQHSVKSLPQKVGIIGCGWLGLPLAEALKKKGHQIRGSTTRPKNIPRLKKIQIEPFLLEIGAQNIKGDIHSFLNELDVLILNFPPLRVPNIVDLYPKQIKHLLPYLSPDIRVIFISSTSVYPNTGNWVDEKSKLVPEKPSGKALKKSEEILEHQLGKRLSILRLAGLIGPGRSPGHFLSGQQNLKRAQVPVNLIHQADAIGLIKTLIQQEAWGLCLNGCADKHPLRKEYYTLAAKRLNLPTPSFSSNPESETEFKKVSNLRSKQLLGYNYQYPDPTCWA
ncbi:MAG: SDR family oxidoreductase [Cytophagales bacterium]|nr:SDR family oxidoreductase [Cytophagales bacterium]